MIASFNTVNFQYSGDVAPMKKSIGEAKDVACEYLIIAGIYTEQINNLVSVLKEIPPREIKAKSIAFVVDHKDGLTHGLDIPTVMTIIELQKIFGEDLKRPCKDYYILTTFMGNQIMCGRTDGQVGAPKTLHEMLKCYFVHEKTK